MQNPWEILKLLADPTRLRILALLREESLSVAELQEILGMGQSRISSHLALLRQRALVQDRRDGKKTYYALANSMTAKGRALLDASLGAVEAEVNFREDAENLKRIVDKRQRFAERYFDLIAGRLGKAYCPGRSWEAIARAFLYLAPPITIADLGAGEGLISQMLARQAKEVLCIDNSPAMVKVGTELAHKNKLSNLSYKLGNIEDVPLLDESVDLALMSQALHHARNPEKALTEAFRILKKGGRIIILDLQEHSFEKARELYADVWLGFSENALYGMLKKSGFVALEISALEKEKEEPHFQTTVASALRP
ncbi:MAG: metalloregulator ArsR/SmtB family transcription factor [Opitutales bacterium]|nr:metalloregulator ArsR/SmtB family transcription factor [Opitutales bacterium]MCH8541324.1 metalloregulator ArsR/SmtB family transcription factor [Opitutales bacterium]